MRPLGQGLHIGNSARYALSAHTSHRVRIISGTSARMTEPNDHSVSDSTLAQSARCRWRYFTLFGTQTIGAFVLYRTALQLYRQVLSDPGSHDAHPWTLVWALSSIALMQVAYWVSHRVRPPLPQFTNALIGHAVLFLARIGFVLPTSFFGFVFVAQRPEFEISAFQYLVILLGLFSLYCYVRDLERLGRAFIAREKGLDATAR